MNTRDYDWSKITLDINGFIVPGITNIEYGTKQEKEGQYAKGVDAHFIGRGNKTVSGTIEMLIGSYNVLEDAAGGDILDLVCTITIHYGNIGDVPRTDKITSAEVTEAMKKTKQGDKSIPISLPFLGLKQFNNI